MRRVSITLREINKDILAAESTKDIGNLIVQTGSKYIGNPS